MAGLFAQFYEGEISLSLFLYVGILTFGSILIPTLLGVLIFQIVKTRIIFSSWTMTFILQILIMLLLMYVGLFLWALFDVVVWSDRLTFSNVKDDFHSEFSGFAISGIFMAIALPFVDKFLTKRYTTK